MSAGSSEEWDSVEVEELQGYTAKDQAEKIEYELEARRKFEQKEFPKQVLATTDDSSDETGADTVPTSNRSSEIPPPEVIQPTTIVEEEEDNLLIDVDQQQPVIFAENETLPENTMKVETVHIEDPEENADDTISPLANATTGKVVKETIGGSAPSRFSLFTTTSKPPNTAGTLTVASSKEPSPVNSHFGGFSPTPSLPSPTARLHFSPLALPPPNTDGFAQVLKERTRQRRAQEDAAVSTLRAQVNRLESALAAESKRRVASIRSLQEQSIQTAQDLQDRLKKQMQDEISLVNNRLSRMEERMASLEQRYNQDMGALQTQMRNDSQNIHEQLQALKTQFAQEEQQRKVRHQHQLSQIQSVADDYLDRWKTERHERLTAVQQLMDTMHSVHSSREQNMATFEGQLTYELQQLEVALTNESSERQLRDQEIVTALNNYVQQLQESLAAAVTRGSVY